MNPLKTKDRLLDQKNIVTEVSGLYPTRVFAEVVPTTVDEVSDALRRYQGPVSIGGGRFSMGGQIASENSLHLDMRKLNKVDKPFFFQVRVQAGATWRDIQKVIDPYDYSIAIMQSFSNFTVGGSLSVNVHGRYVGQGALIHSVLEITLVLADGRVVTASRTQNPDLFYAAIGGYGGIGVIVEVVLRLVPNTKVERCSETMSLSGYLDFFRDNIRNNSGVVFHNADIYPPHYSTVRAISWRETEKEVTQPARLYKTPLAYPKEQYFAWSISELPFGKWRREHILEPLIDRKSFVHWRNYEAGYDVGMLEPVSRSSSTYVLQEYFVPVVHCAAFVERMAKVLNDHQVNALNISIRHAKPDTGSYLSWSREEVFAFVLYYKQGTDEASKLEVGVWTRQLIDIALEFRGAYYLPYQVHADKDQFHKAYPNANALFGLKRELDPDYRFRNVLWDTYYTPQPEVAMLTSPVPPVTPAPAENGVYCCDQEADFSLLRENSCWRDQLFLFLKNVYGLYPAGQFFLLLDQHIKALDSHSDVYQKTMKQLPGLAGPLKRAMLGLSALHKQKREMADQTRRLIGDFVPLNYMEIGSKGRYFRGICKPGVTQHLHFVEEKPRGFGITDVLERGSVFPVGTCADLSDYAPLSKVAGSHFDMITCYIGLHHIALDRLEPFIQSIAEALRPGGLFILREHDVDSQEMASFVSLVHTVFNLGLNEPYLNDISERRHFRSQEDWIDLLGRHHLEWQGMGIHQDGDPSRNILMAFRRKELA